MTEPEPAGSDALLSVRNLKKHFPVKQGLFSRVTAWVKAVDGLTFDIGEGETLGLVGESGCGKTTAGRTILRLLEPTEGEAIYRGRNIYDLGPSELRGLRREMQIIFQDPYGSLNPRMTVGSIIGEGLAIHDICPRDERMDRVRDLLERVGLSADYVNRYPHEFSGGQRQRIGVARALAVNPSFIVCDEAVSALDVSIQAQIINLLMDLQEEMTISYLFIAHDLNVVEHISHRICVMYLGRMFELAPYEEIYQNPCNPYTRALLSAIPVPDPTWKKERIVLEGDVPSPMNPPSGCPFRTRCPIAEDICAEEEPPWMEVSPGHWSYCHFADDQEKLDRIATRTGDRAPA